MGRRQNVSAFISTQTCGLKKAEPSQDSENEGVCKAKLIELLTSQ